MMSLLNKRFLPAAGVLFLLTGCAEEPAPKAQEQSDDKVVVEQYVDIKMDFELLHVIQNDATVEQVQELVDGIEWEQANVSMAEFPYGRFHYGKAGSAEAPSPTYSLWISPSKDKVELVVNGEPKYAQLTNEDSNALFQALTGSPLASVKETRP